MKVNKDDNIHKKRSSKKSDLYLNQGPRKSYFPLKLPERQKYIRTDISIYRVASLLKTDITYCHAQLGLLDKDSAINGFVSFNHLDYSVQVHLKGSWTSVLLTSFVRKINQSLMNVSIEIFNKILIHLSIVREGNLFLVHYLLYYTQGNRDMSRDLNCKIDN